MIWKTYNGKIETLKNMTNSRIKSSINYIYNSNKTEFSGFSKAYWILQLKAELCKRRALEDVIINRFPFIQEKLNEIKYNIKYKEEKYKIL